MSENEGGPRLVPSGYRVTAPYGRAAVHPRKDHTEVPGAGWAALAGSIDLDPCHGDTPAEALLVLVAKLREVADSLEIAANRVRSHG